MKLSFLRRSATTRVALEERLWHLEDHLGFYRDTFITHLPCGIYLLGGGESLAMPLDFHFDHGRRDVTERELRLLEKSLRQIEVAEGLDLHSSEDPRGALRDLARMSDGLTLDPSRRTLRNLLKEWGMTSPPPLTVATDLANTLEVWAQLLVDKVRVRAD